MKIINATRVLWPHMEVAHDAHPLPSGRRLAHLHTRPTRVRVISVTGRDGSFRILFFNLLSLLARTRARISNNKTENVKLRALLLFACIAERKALIILRVHFRGASVSKSESEIIKSTTPLSEFEFGANTQTKYSSLLHQNEAVPDTAMVLPLFTSAVRIAAY